MTRSRLIPSLALAIVTIAGCGGEGGSSPGQDLPVPIPQPDGTVDFGCTAEYPTALQVPIEFAFVVKACESLDGQSGTIDNLTNGVVDIRVAAGTVPVTFFGYSTASAEYQMTALAARLGDDGLGGYILGPQSGVVASAATFAIGGPQLELEVEPSASVVGMGATALVGLIGQYTANPIEGLFESGAACIQGAADSFTSLQVGTAEDFVNSMLGLTACKTAFDAIDEFIGQPSVEEAALLRSGEELRPLWDDIARIAGKVITIAR